MSLGFRAQMSLLMLVPGETTHARVRAGWRRGDNLGARDNRGANSNGDNEQEGPGVSLKARIIQDLGCWGMGRGWGQMLRNEGFRGRRSCR